MIRANASQQTPSAESPRAVLEGGIIRKEPENKGFYSTTSRKGWLLWQLTAELPSALYPHPESFFPTDIPAGTYLFYQ
jgi:hypothetical protein